MKGLGISAALLSSALGGTAIGTTRYLAGTLNPVTIGVVRFGGGFVILLALSLQGPRIWPTRRDWPATIGLGMLFFFFFPVLFNAAMIYTTAARAALALSTLPLLTMVIAASLRIEPMTTRKTIGVLVAMSGVAATLNATLSTAPANAWRGDALMMCAALCMAFYNVWSRPLIARSSAIAFATIGMGTGAICLLVVSAGAGDFQVVAELSAAQALACLYLAVVCGAAIFFLWAFALGKAPPTLVAISVTLNPVTATVFGAALLGEPISVMVLVGLAAVASGIVMATR